MFDFIELIGMVLFTFYAILTGEVYIWTLANVCEELRTNWSDILCLLRFASGEGPLDALDLTLRAEIGIPIRLRVLGLVYRAC